jgi:hypothetical protein
MATVTPTATDAHGRTAPERAERRQRIMSRGAKQALAHSLTMRCKYAQELEEAADSAPGTDAEKHLRSQAREQHEQCRGESQAGGTGCMCYHHDPVTGAENG